MKLFEELRKKGSGGGQALLSMMERGELRSDERDKNGLCPLLFAIDASMGLGVI